MGAPAPPMGAPPLWCRPPRTAAASQSHRRSARLSRRRSAAAGAPPGSSSASLRVSPDGLVFRRCARWTMGGWGAQVLLSLPPLPPMQPQEGAPCHGRGPARLAWPSPSPLGPPRPCCCCWGSRTLGMQLLRRERPAAFSRQTGAGGGWTWRIARPDVLGLAAASQLEPATGT